MYKLQISQIIQETVSTRTFIFDKPDDFTWEPGSHIHVGLPGFDLNEEPNKELVRHMSISCLPSQNKVSFTTRVPGSGSLFKRTLNEMNVGDEIAIFKCGIRMPIIREDKQLVLLSMGVGIATMRPIILAVNNNWMGISKLINLNVDAPGQHVFFEELNAIENSKFQNLWIDGKEEYYEKLNELCQPQNTVYYIVGTDAYLIDTIEVLRRNNISAQNILIDKKDNRRAELLVEFT